MKPIQTITSKVHAASLLSGLKPCKVLADGFYPVDMHILLIEREDRFVVAADAIGEEDVCKKIAEYHPEITFGEP